MPKLSILLILLVVLVLVLGGVGLAVAYFETKTLQGAVTDASGAPLANAAVTLAGRSTFSDAQGHFEIQIPRGEYELRAFADGFQEAAQHINAADVWAQHFSAQLVLHPKEWRAQVLAADSNAPLANARVQIGDEALTTNAQGEFVARGVRSGTRIIIEQPGYHAVNVTVKAAGSSAKPTVILLSPAEIRVTVVDATSHQPLPGVRVSANGQNVSTDGNGGAVLKGLTEGAVISARAPGYAEVSARAAKDAQVTLKLQPTTLKGRIVDASMGQAVPNALIVLGNSDAAPALQTDRDGRFALDDFSKVPRLFLKKPGYRLGTFDLTQGGQQEFQLTPFDVRGIHLYYGIRREDAERILDKFKGTEMNAVVFDVKEDPGYLLWDSQVPLAKQIGAYTERSFTAQDEVELCRVYGLYCIARVTVFKDSLLAQNRPALALHNAGGGLLYENAAYWTNPAKQEVQDYHIALAQELAAMGFDEIQFDYIRFPGTTNVLAREFGDAKYRVATIETFLERAGEALRGTTAFFSGDVFGLTTATDDEQGIGQVWENIAPHFDYISPMMYPSTWRYATNLWGAGFGITNCGDAYACAYEIMRYGTDKAQERTKNDWTLVRPWLQAYGMNLQDMLAQARGADDADSAGYLFWNNLGVYPDGLFKSTK